MTKRVHLHSQIYREHPRKPFRFCRLRGEEERQIILLHAVTGLKHREIAGLMELPLATVLSKYHRGLKKMRAQMEGDETP